MYKKANELIHKKLVPTEIYGTMEGFITTSF